MLNHKGINLSGRSRCFVFVVATSLVAACTPNPADDVAKAEVADIAASKSAKASAAVPDAAAASEFIVGSASTVNFTGSKVTGVQKGGFKGVRGSFKLIEPATIVGTNNRIVVDMSTLWSDDDRLTAHLESEDFFNIAMFPTTEFVITRTEKTGDDAYQVSGELSLHGVTKQISFPATVEQDSADSARMRAEFAIKRFDFDIRYPGKPDDLIRDDVVITLDLALRRHG